MSVEDLHNELSDQPETAAQFQEPETQLTPEILKKAHEKVDAAIQKERLFISEDGKYEIRRTAEGRMIALRHGEEWRDLTGDNLIFALTESVKPPLALETPPDQINVRLFDLVRYMRSELHEADLIDLHEYAWLCGQCELAQGDGSPSPRRLESYDRVRARIKELEADLAVARRYVRTEWKAGRLQGPMSTEEIRVFQEGAEHEEVES